MSTSQKPGAEAIVSDAVTEQDVSEAIRDGNRHGAARGADDGPTLPDPGPKTMAQLLAERLDNLRKVRDRSVD